MRRRVCSFIRLFVIGYWILVIGYLIFVIGPSPRCYTNPVEHYPFAFLNPYIQSLFMFTAMTVATLWFAGGHLNAFIGAVLNILLTGLGITLSFFLFPFTWTAHKIYTAYKRIYFPPLVKALIYFSAGIGIFVLDHMYNTVIYAEDQTTFYHIAFRGTTYWISQVAATCGGFFIFLGTVYFLGILWNVFKKLTDHRIRITFIMTR
jgi:hypothetical protein